MNEALSLHNVSNRYRGSDGQALNVICFSRFSLTTGDQVALVGRSGSGKSTLLNLIEGLTPINRPFSSAGPDRYPCSRLPDAWL